MTLGLNPRTLKSPVRFAGQGLFAPVHCVATVQPASPGSGITFVRTDLTGAAVVRADARHVHTPGAEKSRDAARHTVLMPGAGKTGVHTVEHLLSALWGVGITDAHVEVNGPEVPMLDASSAPFVKGLIEAGFAEASQNETRFVEPIVVRERVVVEGAGGARIVCEPVDGPVLALRYELDYGPGGGPVLGPQSAEFVLDWSCPDITGYAQRIAPARTFCTAREAEGFKAAGFFAHLEPGEVLIAGPDGPVGTTLRMEHEPAVHKLLDLIGDLSLAGRPVCARVTAERAGHGLNHRMALALMGMG